MLAEDIVSIKNITHIYIHSHNVKGGDCPIQEGPLSKHIQPWTHPQHSLRLHFPVVGYIGPTCTQGPFVSKRIYVFETLNSNDVSKVTN